MSSFYNDLPANARVYSHQVSVPLQANQTELRLEEKSVVNGQRLVGIWVHTGDGNKDPYGKTIAAENMTRSMYLSILEDTTTIARHIPLTNIENCNLAGTPYFIDTRRVNLSQSTLKIGDMTSFVADTVVVFQFDYLLSE